MTLGIDLNNRQSYIVDGSYQSNIHLTKSLNDFQTQCLVYYWNHYNFDNSSLDIVREYNFLVENHFREKHSVADYADLLNRSPKTISNLFKKLGPKTPLQYIHDRLMLEARRLLHFTDKSIKEVAYDLGFDDLQSFSRFFKKQEGRSPKEFKEISKSGNIVNS